MRKLFIMVTVGILFALNSNYSSAYEKEIKSLSSTMAENISKAGKKTVAVVDFVDLQGNVTELGRFLAEEFSISLAGSRKGFRIVDRTHLRTILKEHKLALTGVIDPTTAKKLGQIAGVDALVTGTITPFGESVRLAVKILDSSTGDIIDALSGDIAKTKAIEELLAKGIDTETREPMTTSASTSPAGRAVEASGIILSPVKCFRKVDVMECTISFQNKSNEEVRLRIGPRPSHLIDNRGNKYPVTILIGDKSSHYSPIEEAFLPQMPVNVHFLSKDVAPTATHMSAVISISRPEVRRGGATTGWGKDKLVGVRNIPITK